MRRSAAPSKIRSNPHFVASIHNVAIKRHQSPDADTTRKIIKTSLNEGSPNVTKTDSQSEICTAPTRYFFVMWCKLSKKKHKIWEGDALLITTGRTAVLKDMNGKEMGRSSGIQLKVLNDLEDGSMLAIGGKEVEIQSSLSAEEYNKKRCGESSSEILVESNSVNSRPKFKPFCLPLRAFDKENYNHIPGKPLHDVSNPSSILLPKPPTMLKVNMRNVSIVDVVVDPFVGSNLRPHQKTGISFLYESVMSFRLPGFSGCILADEMGMGKSLQCICLIWTLLRQGPYGGKPVIRKALIVTPSSLSVNWKKEFDKWLGSERINVYVVDQQHKELYALVEFVNPGILGTASSFRKYFEVDIVKSKQPEVSAEDKEFGDKKVCELNRLLEKFILRRTQDMLSKYLPPKNEYVVFCRAMEKQTLAYASIIQSRFAQQCIDDVHQGDHLVAINALRKVCNHPLLLRKQENYEESTFGINVTEMEKQCLEENSGKLAVLSCMLNALQEREKVVIVSHFTTTLDVLQDLCDVYNYSFLRLDGSTPTSTRQQIVNRFNTNSSNDFILLLSAKAGGLGLNLIGSSRIILYDIDWNPATDLQSMARIWRDGQKREVHIYRLLLAGSIEEKIYQRQICKQGISDSVVDSKKNYKNKFSTQELKDLFKFDANSECLTHDMLNCACQMDGQVNNSLRDCELVKETEGSYESLKAVDEISSWQHFKGPIVDGYLQDFCLESGGDFITFVFKCRYNEDSHNTIEQTL